MEKDVICPNCSYSWHMNSKRPDPRWINCPNCHQFVELRPSKLEGVN